MVCLYVRVIRVLAYRSVFPRELYLSLALPRSIPCQLDMPRPFLFTSVPTPRPCVTCHRHYPFVLTLVSLFLCPIALDDLSPIHYISDGVSIRLVDS